MTLCYGFHSVVGRCLVFSFLVTLLAQAEPSESSWRSNNKKVAINNPPTTSRASFTTEPGYPPQKPEPQQQYRSSRSRRPLNRPWSSPLAHDPLSSAQGANCSQRGGAIPTKTISSKALVKTSTTNKATVAKEEGSQTQTAISSSRSIALVKPSQISHQVDEVRLAAKRWKRREFLALLLARVTFALTLPISAALMVLSLALSLVSTVLRIVTLNFGVRETSRIMYAITKALFATVLASVAGILLPVFAIFGWVAAVAEAACEMAEPLLRIRYQRQLRKLRHLQTILTDPVLMETMEYLLKGAEAVSLATAQHVTETGQRVGAASARGSRFAWRASQKAAQQVQDNSVQLVETLISSPEVQQLRETVNSKLPSRVQEWSQDQWESLRKSGVLEDAARTALTALQKELSAAATFLPYLEAIKNVREKQVQKQGASL